LLVLWDREDAIMLNPLILIKLCLLCGGEFTSFAASENCNLPVVLDWEDAIAVA
jgi:hypothetical protein